MKYGKDDCRGKGKPEGTALTRRWLVVNPDKSNRHDRRKAIKLGMPPEEEVK